MAVSYVMLYMPHLSLCRSVCVLQLQDGNQGPPQSPTTKDLMDVSRILSTDWKMLVREMDIPDSEINAIVERYKFDEPWEQKYQCLRYWLDTKGEHASFKELIEAARKRGQANLAREIEAISKGGMSGMWHCSYGLCMCA